VFRSGLELHHALRRDLDLLSGLGFRPVRADCLEILNDPNPVSDTVSPLFSAFVVALTNASSALFASAFDSPLSAPRSDAVSREIR
jgi:hypothetical protein